MGSVAIDVNESERKLDELYPMDSTEGVEVFLEHYNHLKEMVYFSSDYDALIRVIDFELALIETNLSPKERKALYLIYVKDLKRVDVAKEYGVAKQTVQKWVERAIEKIAKYYKEVGE